MRGVRGVKGEEKGMASCNVERRSKLMAFDFFFLAGADVYVRVSTFGCFVVGSFFLLSFFLSRF